LKIALVAGEASGDTLGAALIEALSQRHPGAEFVGVGGPKMQGLGLKALAHSEELAVMGLTEVLRHLPRLLALRSRLRRELLAERPDVFVGIDAPEFNLGVARWLKRRGLKTVQYVSPQVWAWRQGRVRTIGQAVDLVLCLLPFETQFYTDHRVNAEFVGHPLADQIPLEVDRAAAREALGLQSASLVLAVLPGSRMGEVTRLAEDFVAAAALFAANRPAAGVDVRVIAPFANAATRLHFAAVLRRVAPQLPIQILDGQAQLALAAADVVLVASGTATLETMLSKRPMVVAYRLGTLTALLLRRLSLVKVPYFSQPNLLLGEARVPELFQEQITPAVLANALQREIDSPARMAELQQRFAQQHQRLRCGGAVRAADAIDRLLGR
jgi:lipid-A-disaccharide synthase